MTHTSALGLPWARPLRRADLRLTPDDGHRYELVDGTLLLTPSCTVGHQHVLGELSLMLRRLCPEGWVALPGPVEVPLTDSTVLAPDVVVAVKPTARGDDLGVPLLAVEVLDETTRDFDLELKRGCYQDAGCPSYWVVDPYAPSIVAWELRHGAYAEVGRASGEDALSLTQPFPITVVPARLLD